jgi:hypothetical protein
MTTTPIADSPSPSNRRRLPLRALAALFLLALSGLVLLAACGGDDDEEGTPSTEETRTPAATASAGETQTPEETAQPAAGELDPCALLTKADADAIVGASLSEPERQTVGPFETCIYSDDAGNYVQVQVSSDVYTESSFDDAMQAAAEELDIEAKSVSGLGDKAYWLSGVLWIQKGDVSLNVLVETPELFELRLQEDTEAEEQAALALATDLAEKALGRLS